MTQQPTECSISSQLQELKKIIGRNYRQKLSDDTGFSTRRVSQVFKDEDMNHPIIHAAIAMATQIKEKNATATASLEKL